MGDFTLTESNSRYCAEYKRRIKAQALEILGNKCKRCEITDQRVLQIDHIKMTNYKVGHPLRGGIGLQLAIVQGRVDLSELQLLCANCNWIKRFELQEHSKKHERVYVS